jgi:release factor glutamine methyltransferase
MNVAQALAAAGASGLDRLDAQLLLLHALGRADTERSWLVAHDGDGVPAEAQDKFLAFCRRRADGEPVAYIVGHKEFFGLPLAVGEGVLVPRPDTETLVEWALEVLGDHARVVDLGTGSGAIALAIKKLRPAATVEAVDASPDALRIAQANARALSLDVGFRQASWLQGSASDYDLIVSNPPYVAANDPHLAALRHEPLEALVAGLDGLQDIRAIVAAAPGHLRPGGWLLLEHGWDQALDVRALLSAAGFTGVGSRKDLSGIARCSGGKWLELG